MNIFDTLKRLCTDTTAVALELLKEYAPDASLDCHGSVVGLVKRRSSDDTNVETLLIDAHIDRVGLIVTAIDDRGFIKAEPCGGIDRRCLAGSAVTVHTQSASVKGIVCTLPPHAKKSEGQDTEKSMKADSIRIDAGLSGDRAREVISPGDFVSPDGQLTSLTGKMVSAPALDNRAGVCAVLYALHLLRNTNTKYNIAVSFSVAEELGCRGAAVTAYNSNAEYAIVVDVSHGSLDRSVIPQANRDGTFGNLGGGPMIGYAPSLNRKMFEELKQAAENWDISYQLEIMNGDTGGTNADAVSTVKGGIKTALVSIPLRYMHTPVETADLSDIEAVGHLIAAFIEQ